MAYFEFIGNKPENKQEYTVVRNGKSYVFFANPRFGGRWIARIPEASVVAELEEYTKTFRVIREGEALKEDEEFVRLVVKNPNVVREILEAKETVGQIEKESEVSESAPDNVPPEEMKWAELIALAKEKNVPYGRRKRGAIIAALKKTEG